MTTLTWSAKACSDTVLKAAEHKGFKARHRASSKAIFVETSSLRGWGIEPCGRHTHFAELRARSLRSIEGPLGRFPPGSAFIADRSQLFVSLILSSCKGLPMYHVGC